MAKVIFNIKKLQVSPISSISAAGVPTYASPIKAPGTVSLTLDAEGDTEPFYADGIVYYSAGAATTYTGTLENALLPNEILTAVFKYFKDANGNMVETDEVPSEFGMQFACDSDNGEVLFTLFRCTATKPNLNLQTKESSTTINPQSLDLTVMPVTLSDGTNVIKASCEKGDTNYDTFMDKIELPSKSTD